MRNWTIAAIDPGSVPAICVLRDRGETLQFFTDKDVATLQSQFHKKAFVCPHRVANVLDLAQPDLVVLESVWVRPGQGISSQAKLVLSMGLLHGLAVGLGFNLLRLQPQTWLKWHGLLRATKPGHRVLATTIAPHQYAHHFIKVKQHNNADAYLMALFGQAYMDAAYNVAIDRGAPYDYVPKVYANR